MRNRLLAAFVAAGLTATPLAESAALAQLDEREPAGGSPLRRQVLDGLRPTIERRLGPPVEFVIHRLRVWQDWALVLATPQRPGGRDIDGRRIFGAAYAEMDGIEIQAVLRRRAGRWTVVRHWIGATDVEYCDPAVGTPRGLTDC